MDEIATDLEARGGAGFGAQQAVAPGLDRLAAQDVAVVVLLKLVALDGVVHEKGEVAEEVEERAHVIGLQGHGGGRVSAPPFPGQAPPVFLAPVAGAEASVGADQPLLHRPFGDLVGSVPVALVAGAGHVPALGVGTRAVTHEGVVLFIVFRNVPGAVGMLGFHGVGELIRPQGAGIGGHGPLVAEITQGDLGDGEGETSEGSDLGAARR